MHDPIYKRLFDFPDMVRDLLRAVGGDWIADVDLDTLDKLPAEYVGDSGQARRGDAVWRVRFRNGWLYLLVVLEFQSTNDTRMALRNLEYTALLYRELDRRKVLGPPGRWPPVLPVVLYNGDVPWTAALEMRDLIADVPEVLLSCQPSQRSLILDERHVAVDDLPSGNLMRGVTGLEQSRTPGDLLRAARGMIGRLRSPENEDLSRAFRTWLDHLAERMRPGQADWAPGRILEDATMTTLAERVAQWPEQWRREGVAEGRKERAAQERDLLRRLAALRFGDAFAERVEGLLGTTEDWDQLAAVAELIVGAETEAGLIDGIGRRIRSG